MPKPAETVEGVFRHLIYSPRGDHEGTLLECDGRPLQLVFERHDGTAGRVFDRVDAGQTVRVEVAPQGPSATGESGHAVHAFCRLVSVDGGKPAVAAVAPAGPAGPAYRGKVVRLNYARHGAANGVVLDSGDFIHLKPAGMTALMIGVGDTVAADGDARRLVDDSGWAVEATTVNGRLLKRH